MLCALAGLTFASCAVGLEPYHAPDGIDATFDHRASGHHLFKPDVTFTSQADIAREVRSVHYVAESGSGAFWHTAHVKSQIGYEIRQHKTIEGAKRYITKMKKEYHV